MNKKKSTHFILHLSNIQHTMEPGSLQGVAVHKVVIYWGSGREGGEGGSGRGSKKLGV